MCRGVVAVFVRAVLRFLRARARDDGVVDGRGGAVAVIQRFGGALNLNLHVHALVLDGVFARSRAGVLNFHPTRGLTALDVEEVLATVEPRITRLLDRRGLGDDDAEGATSDAWVDEAPVTGRTGGGVCAGDRGAWILSAALASVAWGTPVRRANSRTREAVTRVRTASICTRGSWCRQDTRIASSVCAAMR